MFRLSRADYVKEWGGTKPRLSVRALTFFYKLAAENRTPEAAGIRSRRRLKASGHWTRAQEPSAVSNRPCSPFARDAFV